MKMSERNKKFTITIKSGEEPGKGMYICNNCGKAVVLYDNDTLPPCPKCGCIYYH